MYVIILLEVCMFMSFGEILKKIREDNNLTQEELAKKVNTSRSNIANYDAAVAVYNASIETTIAADLAIKKRLRLCLKFSDRRKSPPPPKDKIIAKNNQPDVLLMYKSVIKTNSSPTNKINNPPTKSEMVLKIGLFIRPPL